MADVYSSATLSTDPRSGRIQALILILVGVFLAWTFVLVGEHYVHDYELDLGSLTFPAPRYFAFISLWLFFGLLAAAALTFGITSLLVDRGNGHPHPFGLVYRGSDRVWIAVAAVAGAVIPAAIRAFVLNDAPVVDDASAYQFSAELLASGRLVVESPPDKLFFDRQFMINDGRLYSQYFLGWPALMVPGVWLGVPGYVNALYSALTVPAVFLVLRRLTGSTGARVGVILYLGSPLLMMAAATQMAHTTCFAALAWLTWFVLRSRDDDGPAWAHACVALAFSVAFFIRPLTAVGAGVPLLVWWAMGAWRRPLPQRLRAGAAFAVVAVLFGALFLAVNHAQNGSFSRVAYQAMTDYARSNDYRFTTYGDGSGETIDWARDADASVATAGVALVRLNPAVFGWPCSLFLALFAVRSRRARPLWASLAFFFVAHLNVRSIGVDSFGPTHYVEASWPILILSVAGLRAAYVRVRSWRQRLGVPAAWELAAPVACSVLVALALLCYVPPRLAALERVGRGVNLALRAPERAGLRDAVIFSPAPFVPRCATAPTRHWVFFRPNNDPDLDNSVLWVNDLGERANLDFMRGFPTRHGYRLVWGQGCEPVLHALGGVP